MHVLQETSDGLGPVILLELCNIVSDVSTGAHMSGEESYTCTLSSMPCFECIYIYVHIAQSEFTLKGSQWEE